MTAVPRENDLVSIEVPADVAAALNAQVAAGDYDTAGDVVRRGLRLISEEESILHSPEIDRWLTGVAMPIAEATVADPSRSLTSEQVRAELIEKRPRVR